MANRELTFDVSIGNIDEMVSDLKRVQREAKKATQAVRELEAEIIRASGVPADKLKGGAGE